jgi:apolipoprotein N-acyltransferase
VRLRAVEQRRFIVRASTSGPSAVVDTLGRVATRTAFFTQAVIGGTIALRDEVTLYNRVGDLFAGLCAVVALSAWVARSREV